MKKIARPKGKIRGESRYYPMIEKFLKRRFNCFTTSKNRGTLFGRIDVIGLRDIGGDLSGNVEIIGVEVKAGNQPFNTATGQAFGYSIYAERCYLADARPGITPYSLDEIDIASKLGVGLLAIRPNGTVSEILASPEHTPMPNMRADIIEKLIYAQCVICNSVFKRGDETSYNRFVKRNLLKAMKEEKGYVYWLWEVNNRRKIKLAYNYVRRYICSDCVQALYREMNNLRNK
jgi:hypothetical protein